jgi:hypothetical protein
MSYVDDLIESYRHRVALPWEQGLAGEQRVWMVIYPPEHERRVRLHISAFETATLHAGHSWKLFDITNSFEKWMSGLKHREAYFEAPSELDTSAYHDQLVARLRSELEATDDPDGVVALLGAGTQFGLGETVKVSSLVSQATDRIAGRLVVFFPGEHEGNSYRLLDARDGWNYLAIPIEANGSHR